MSFSTFLYHSLYLYLAFSFYTSSISCLSCLFSVTFSILYFKLIIFLLRPLFLFLLILSLYSLPSCLFSFLSIFFNIFNFFSVLDLQ